MSTEKLEEMFTEDDLNELNQIQTIRKNILRNIGIENFIELVREIIDESKNFEFTSAIKRKFINVNTPIFTIRKIGYAADKSKFNNEDYINSEINKIVAEINEDILRNTTTKILEFIQTDEKLKEIYSNLNEDLKDILWTTVYEIKVSVKDNIIYIRYCI